MIDHDIKLSEILADKGSHIYRVEPDVTVAEAVALMNQMNIGAVLVMRGERLAGMFTERDVLIRIVGAGRDPAKTPVHEVMTKNLIAVKPSTTVEQAMRIVTEKRFRHLPVVEDDRVLGMVSIGDLTRSLIRTDESYIHTLVHYIEGTYPA